jgi:hypothetical protein
MRPVFGPAGDDDARTAYVFRCGETDLYAITLEETGSNLPADWRDAASNPHGTSQ